MTFTTTDYLDENFHSVRIVEATDFDEGDEATAVKAVRDRFFTDVDATPGLQVLAHRCEIDPPAPEVRRMGRDRPGVTIPPGLKRRILVAMVWTIAAELVGAELN